MRTLSFVNYFAYEYKGNVFNDALALGDIDNDKVRV